MAVSGAFASEFLLIARILFGSILAFTGLNHFLDLESMVPYAEAKGVPAPKFGVIVSGGLLVLGGIGIALGAFPVLAAGALVLFFVVTTPVMHDFWAREGEQVQQEMTHFLKNVALLGGALAFLALGTESWAYGLGVGLF